MTRWLTRPFGLVLLAALTAATAHASDCYDMKNPDARQKCLAETRGDPSRCYSIANPDEKNVYLARTKSQRSYFYPIRDPDLRNRCLAETP